MKTTIMGVKVSNREDAAVSVQKLLTEYGCIIKTRLGVHEAGNMCSSNGTIILEFVSDKEDEIVKLHTELDAVDGVVVGKMEL